MAISYKKFFFPKTAPGDYLFSDQPTLRDWLLSLRPRDEAQLFITVLFSFNYWQLVSGVPWSTLKFETFPEINIVIILFFQTLSLGALVLKLEEYFYFQVASGLLGVIALLLSPNHHVTYAETIGHFFGLFWICFNVSALYFSSKRIQVVHFPWRVSRQMRPRGFPPRKEGRFRILLIEPSIRENDSFFSNRRSMYPSILPHVAALLPDNWDVMILDQVYDEIDYSLDVDIVGMTTMAPYFPAMVEISKGFRAKGKTILVGGADCSRQPESYLDHADCVLIGEADGGYLQQILDDWSQGKLKKKYLNPQLSDLQNIKLPRNDLLPLRRYLNLHNILVSTSCPYACEFCNHNKTRAKRMRPVADVLRAVRATPAKYFWFEAPELLVYREYVKELAAALKGEKILFASHSTMKSATHDETLRLARQAGLRAVWLGLESYSQSTLDFVNKKMNRVSDFGETFKKLNKFGISANVHLMFGFPDDKIEDYRAAVKGVIAGKSSHIEVHPVVAFGGDEAFRAKMFANGAKPLNLQINFPNQQNFPFTFFVPKGMTERQYVQEFNRVSKVYFSWSSIFRRLFFRSPRNFSNLLPDFFMNLFSKLTGRQYSGDALKFEAFIEDHFRLPRGSVSRLILDDEIPPEVLRSVEPHFKSS